MIDKKVFYNIKCDCCGRLLDEQYWDVEEGATAFIDECGWKVTEDGKHYCPDCFEHDDNDRMVTKDGHVYDAEDYPLSESDIMFNNPPEMKALLSQKVEELDLSVRTRNILKANGIDTILDLCRMKKTDCLKFRNGGKRSLTELDDFLTAHNLMWGMDV